MKIQLLQYSNNYYLSFGSEKVRALSKNEARDFLRNYDSDAYYNRTENDIALTNAEINEGELMAVVEDNGELRICNAELIRELFSVNSFPYLTTEEFAEKHNRKQSIVLRLCRDGRLEGAIQKHSVWLIPEDTPYPADARVGSRVPSARSRTNSKQ